MRKVSVANVKARLNAYVDEAETTGPIVIMRNGKPVAVLLAMQDEDEIERMILAYSPKFQRILHTAERQIQAGQGIPHKEFWQEIEKAQPK
jgi:prevent-host-death family protein